RIAAALVIVVGGGAVALRIMGSSHQSSASAPADLDGLSTDQLKQVLDGVGESGGEAVVSVQDVSLDDLNTVVLRALLESPEGGWSDSYACCCLPAPRRSSGKSRGIRGKLHLRTGRR